MKTFFYIIFSLFAIQLSGQTIHYVNPLAQGQNNGSSWANAFASLHEGFSAASLGMPFGSRSQSTAQQPEPTKPFVLN